MGYICSPSFSVVHVSLHARLLRSVTRSVGFLGLGVGTNLIPLIRSFGFE